MMFEKKGQLFNSQMGADEKDAVISQEILKNAYETAITNGIINKEDTTMEEFGKLSMVEIAEMLKHEERLKMIFSLAKKNEIVREDTSYEEFKKRDDLDQLIKELTIEQQD